MTLTTDQIARVFAMYIGAEVIGQPYNTRSVLRQFGSAVATQPITGELIGVTNMRATVQYRNVNRDPWEELMHVSFKELQLNLYDLSDISDVDKIEFISIGYNGPERLKFANAHLAKIAMGVSTISFARADYLRSRGYALPYLGHNLFDLGLAIRKRREA